jgi:LysM repeat protein
MIKYLLSALFFLSFSGLAVATIIDEMADAGRSNLVLESSVSDQDEYIRRFKVIAMREMERSGVPASIKLAQGILESGAGSSKLARSANNHFGIKCGSNWNGDTYFREDDDYDEEGRLIKSCFRQYRNAEASFVAHSEFLRDPAKSFRYGFLFRLDPADYKAWANGLRTSGYATNPSYPELLISIIERNNLQQFDQSSVVIDNPGVVTTPIEDLQRGILRTNDVSYFINDAPISVNEIARQVDISVDRLLDYNEGLRQEGQQVSPGDRVFLQKKRRAFRGYEQFHTVQEGENLYDVAQRYGLRLDKLARRNRLQEDSDPATGEEIKLRCGRVKEAVRLEGEIDPNVTNPNIPTNENGQIDMDEPTAPSRPPTTKPSVPTTVPTPPRPVPPTVIPPTVTNPPGQPTTNPTPSTGQVHVVAAGETLYAISRRYGLTVDQLKQLNRLTTNNIAIGQRLIVR